jgi:hypothetical protein
MYENCTCSVCGVVRAVENVPSVQARVNVCARARVCVFVCVCVCMCVCVCDEVGVRSISERSQLIPNSIPTRESCAHFSNGPPKDITVPFDLDTIRQGGPARDGAQRGLLLGTHVREASGGALHTAKAGPGGGAELCSWGHGKLVRGATYPQASRASRSPVSWGSRLLAPMLNPQSKIQDPCNSQQHWRPAGTFGGDHPWEHSVPARRLAPWPAC